MIRSRWPRDPDVLSPALTQWIESELGGAVARSERIGSGASREYPVESLNAAMILAEIHARSGSARELEVVLSRALEDYGRLADDFEVKVNFRLHDWMVAALGSAHAGELDAIRAYRFAC